MQAITVRFLGVTRTKPARLCVETQGRRVLYSAGHFCMTDDRLDKRGAAEAHAASLGWTGPAYGDLIHGSLPNGTDVYVFSVPDTAERAVTGRS